MIRPTVVFVIVLAALACVGLDGRAVIVQPASILPTWIAGCWAGTRGGEQFHERWTLADATTLLGLSHTVKAGTLTAFEFLRVVVRDGKAVYVAQPGGVPPTEFTATEQTADRVVFENPSHDFPKRVIYERPATGRLTASIDGGPSSRQRVEYAMTRVPCER